MNVRILGVGFLLVAILATPVAARELTIKHFDAQIRVNSDATLDVSETIQVHFSGAWNGLYRTIPTTYRTPQGLNYSLFLSVIGATDDSGNQLKLESNRDAANQKFKIWVPGATDVTRTITFRYSVENGLRFFEDHDELYWNITGNQWDFPIEDATAQIDLPDGVSGIRTLAFTGATGAQGHDADIETEGNMIAIRMRRPLAFHEGVTAAIGWDKGLVREPGWVDRAEILVRSNWPLAVPFVFPVLAFGIMFRLWYTRGRDPGSQAIVVQYEPPDNLSPAEVATLVDNEVDMRDITATVVDLAVRGHIAIEQQPQEGKFFGHSNEYVFHRKKEKEMSKGLRPHETQIMDALFNHGSRDSVTLSALHNEFYGYVPRIKNQIFSSLTAANYYRQSPDAGRPDYFMRGVMAGSAAFFGGVLLLILEGGLAVNDAVYMPMPTVDQLNFSVLGAAAATCVCVWGFGLFMGARTVAAARAREKILGFEEFLNRVEEPRFERVIKTPEMFEKFLPYAMALQVEKKWGKAFAGIYKEPPDWFQGGYGTGFTPIFFVNDLGLMADQARSVMQSSPRSSGSSIDTSNSVGSSWGGSGFSGGSSGGGAGGGGGGGF